jgi:hypothetical protein
MRIREDHPFRSEPIHPRRGDLAMLWIEAANITVPKVIANQKNDVGPRISRRKPTCKTKKRDVEQEYLHGGCW